MDRTAEIPALVENEQLSATFGQSCSGIQLGDVSVSDPKAPQICFEMSEQAPEHNSSRLSDETAITIGSNSQTATLDSQESLLLKRAIKC